MFLKFGHYVADCLIRYNCYRLVKCIYCRKPNFSKHILVNTYFSVHELTSWRSIVEADARFLGQEIHVLFMVPKGFFTYTQAVTTTDTLTK